MSILFSKSLMFSPALREASTYGVDIIYNKANAGLCEVLEKAKDESGEMFLRIIAEIIDDSDE